jgi:hypothetical protein
MDTCPKCGLLLRVGKSYYTFENDTTPDLPTKGYINLEMLCLNADCSEYAGEDIDNPKAIVDTVKNGVN